MKIINISNYIAVTEKIHNFPDLTITITKRGKEDSNLDEKYLYIAEPDYAIWTPGNSLAPYRHTGYGRTIEEAAKEAVETYESQLFDEYSNDEIFVTKATSPYWDDAPFYDGNGKAYTYNDAREIVSKKKLNHRNNIGHN